ncbi:MAG: DoxX family protein [Candidatus Micrarchaeota archaeon]|nr:DoxX family protein [Candidatus Micrarchaeota archaeon]
MAKTGWFFQHRSALKTSIRVIFGIVWLIDGIFKFIFLDPNMFSQMVQAGGNGQPSWMMPWFNFWATTVSQMPQFWYYLIGISETLLGLALIFGFMRKTAYSLGLVLSLLIWSVPEGLGGPYGPSSTDIGTGIIYAIVFLALILINTEFGPSKYSLDRIIEKRVKWWRKIAEF